VQSLCSKIDNLKSFLISLTNGKVPIAAIALQEIWSCPVLLDLQIPGFKLAVNCRKKQKGGGVGFYVNDLYIYKILKNLTIMNERIFESIGIEITIRNKKIILANYYRSPNPPQELTLSQSHDLFIDQLSDYTSVLNETNLPCYIFSDTNINLLKLSYDNFAELYFNTVLLNGFIQVVGKATRIQGPTFSLIDHIATNYLTSSLTCGVIVSDISDHFFTFTVHDLPLKEQIPEFISKRNFSLTNLSDFKTALRDTNWQTTLNARDVNESYNCFWNIFSNLYEQHFPLRKVKRNKNFHKINNFMTQGLLNSRNTKNSLHKASLLNPTEFNTSYYRNYRNIYNKLLRKAKTLYYDNELKNCKDNPKKTWDILKEAMNCQNSDNSIPEINCNNIILTDNNLKANAFNNFFANIGNEINMSIPASSTSPSDYLNNLHEPPLLDLGNVGPSHVSDIIKSLPTKASCDHLGISLKLVKFVRVELSTPLAHIFNRSLEVGVFPTGLKCSRTVPVYKSGPKNICDNYRPISLVPTFSKILEKIVAVKLTNHLDLNNLLYKHQYGFQRGKQTEHNLINLVNFVSNAINNNKYCIGIFLDIKKAFDCVQHDILFKKLQMLGIRDTCLDWFNSYLSNRTQKVDINGSFSDIRNINIGVLQGSTLGPILFLCFINDLPLSTTMYSLLFADDTACLAEHEDINQLQNFVNNELQKLAIWFKTNKLAVNVKKTKYSVFHTKQKKIDFSNFKILFNENDLNCNNQDKITELDRIAIDNPIESERTYKYLGIYLDEHLSFDLHVKYLTSKLSRSLYFLSKVKYKLPKKSLINLYYALVHPHFLYCTNIFGCTNSTNLKKIETIQKSAIRIISLKKHNFPTKNLFIEHGILPFKSIIEYQKASFMHSIFYEYCPISMRESFVKNQNDHNHDLRNINNFYVVRPRIDWFKKMPLFSFTSHWNSLQEDKLYQNRTTFQIMLKGRLLMNLQ